MTALLLVDLQNDFMPGGALAVPNGDEVVAVANRLAPRYELVVATQDWHPPNHGSFASNHPGKKPYDVVDLHGVQQTLWPDHCVQGTPGASFHSGLDIGPIDQVVRKGTDPAIDSYSTFFDNARRKETRLHDFLREQGVDNLDVMGLATDYCVLFSVLDARELSYEVRVLREGCRGIGLNKGDIDFAFRKMSEAGARLD